MADYEFRYAPLTGRLTGKQMIEQTEQAINQLSSFVDSAAGQVEIISTLANEANENAATALEVANEALTTTGRTYITVSTQTDANNYYDSQLIYIADSTSTNIPVADTGMLEVKTNDNKTACEQVFISDSSGDAYYRNGAITAETVGDVTTYSVTWSGWSSKPASQSYVQGELTNYLPLSGGTLTGVVNGVTPPNGDNSKKLATTEFVNAKAGNYLPLSGGTMTGELVFGSGTGQGHMKVIGDYFRISTTKSSYSENPGAGLVLRGRTATTDAGSFLLEAKSNSGRKNLLGKPDGTLTWEGQPLLLVGVVQAFAGSTIPTGWLLCDGSAVSRTTYASLYACIGTTYGAGDGSTTFNLPNLVNKFVEGSATAGTVKSAGLPNITGSFNTYKQDKYSNGCIDAKSGWSEKRTLTSTTDETYMGQVFFNASLSSSVYGNSTTVQPPALTMRYIIKY